MFGLWSRDKHRRANEEIERAKRLSAWYEDEVRVRAQEKKAYVCTKDILQRLTRDASVDHLLEGVGSLGRLAHPPELVRGLRGPESSSQSFKEGGHGSRGGRPWTDSERGDGDAGLTGRQWFAAVRWFGASRFDLAAVS